MSNNIIFVLMYHRHRRLDLIVNLIRNSQIRKQLSFWLRFYTMRSVSVFFFALFETFNLKAIAPRRPNALPRNIHNVI
jgi:hypothetical protein